MYNLGILQKDKVFEHVIYASFELFVFLIGKKMLGPLRDSLNRLQNFDIF